MTGPQVRETPIVPHWPLRYDGASSRTRTKNDNPDTVRSGAVKSGIFSGSKRREAARAAARMTTELRILAWSVLLGLVHIVLATIGASIQRDSKWNLGPRDIPQPPLTGLAGRLQRTAHNFMETFPLFAAAILIGDAINQHGRLVILGAQLYFWGRVAYLPLYAAGVPVAGSVVWTVATLGILLVIVGLL